MDEVIGYRLVRTLGVGSRGTVQLARPRSGESAVALKVFDAGVSVDVIDHEAAVLSAVASEHVVALLDVCSLPGAPPVFVLERLNTTSLAWLLRSRSRLSIGEAITVLVSMTRGVRALHDAGFAHGRLGAAKVLFGAGNRPVIAGLGHAISLASSAAPAAGATSGSATVGTGGDAASAARLADWRAVRDIAVAVFDRVDVLGREAQVDEVRSAFDAMAGGRGLAGDHERVEDALFALAPPAPVAVRPRSMRAPGSADGTATAVRAAASAPIRGPGRRSADSEQQEPPGRHDKPEPAPAGRRRHSSRRREPGWADGRAVGRALGRIAEQTLERGPLSILREHVARLVRARRRPVAVAAILATGLVAGGVLLLPPSQQAADAGTRATAPPSPRSSPRPLPSDAQASAIASSGAATGGTATGGRATGGTAMGGGHDPTESPGASDDPITSDDPVAAASALFDARSRCLRGRSAACLASVDERTSPVYADDVDRTARTSTRDAGDEADYAQFGVSLIERIGGSALVALSPPSGATDAEPATALVIKGEAGWRIRQIYLN